MRRNKETMEKVGLTETHENGELGFKFANHEMVIIRLIVTLFH